VIFAAGAKGFFPGGRHFHVTHSKLREIYFSTKKLVRNYQISKSRGPGGAHIAVMLCVHFCCFSSLFICTRVSSQELNYIFSWIHGLFMCVGK